MDSLEGSVRRGKLRVTERPKGNPLLAYAIKANDKKVVDFLISQGANVNDVDQAGDPLVFLAFTNELFDGTDLGRHLFSRGASPHVRMSPGSGGKTLEEVAKNHTARYWIQEALRQPAVSVEVARVLQDAECLWVRGLPFTVVGQPIAKEVVGKAITNFKLNPKEGKPLVLLFAGPSGHGKSVLSELLAELAGIPYELIRCENFRDEKTMFGAQAPYVGSQKGSQLNNFIAERNEKPGLVLLDEFEKSTSEVWNGFLGVFENGKYTDRRVREGRVIDCSQLIFILTTNVADPRIIEFYGNSTILRAPKGSVGESELEREYYNLCEEIKSTAAAGLSVPVVGRMNAVVPFIPFNSEESLVVADSVTRESQLRFAEPRGKKKKLPSLKVEVTEGVSGHLGRFYRPDLGARSIREAVETQLDQAVTSAWTESLSELPPSLPPLFYSVHLLEFFFFFFSFFFFLFFSFFSFLPFFLSFFLSSFLSFFLSFFLSSSSSSFRHSK